jgi:hypothetical protein
MSGYFRPTTLAAGTGTYGSIPKSAPKATLDHLATLLLEPALKMSMVIVDGAKAHRSKVAWRDHETVGVMGELFSIWNYHSASIGWTENPTYVKHNRELLLEMQQYRICKDSEETVQYVKRLTASM